MDDERAELKARVLNQLLTGRKTTATEELAEYVKNTLSIYTIRDDDKPEMWAYDEKKGIYVPNGKSRVKAICRQFLGEATTPQIVNAILFKIETDTYIDAVDFFNSDVEEHRDDIVVENGILNTKTRELRPHTPDEIHFNHLPVTYDPNASCPAIDKHLREVTKHRKDVDVIYEYIGSCFIKEYFHERAMLFSGGGRNGKSKTIELIKRLLGPENCAGVTLHAIDANRFQMAGLVKKLANLAGELNNDAIQHTGNFKSLVGRDMLEADRKFKTPIKFIN